MWTVCMAPVPCSARVCRCSLGRQIKAATFSKQILRRCRRTLWQRPGSSTPVAILSCASLTGFQPFATWQAAPKSARGLAQSKSFAESACSHSPRPPRRTLFKARLTRSPSQPTMPHPLSTMCCLWEDRGSFMRAIKQMPAIFGLGCCFLLSACHRQESAKMEMAVFRLFDLFQPDDLTGKVTPENAGWKRVEWRVQDMAPWTPPAKTNDTNSPQPAPIQTAALGFRAVQDLDEPKIKEGQLTGEITGPEPVLDFALKENRGGAESVK